MNTGFLGPAVATAPTVYGIETKVRTQRPLLVGHQLQQHLPFTVLKRIIRPTIRRLSSLVATAPTVYGIETLTQYLSFIH